MIMLHHEKFLTVCLLIVGILLLAYAPAFFPSSFVAQVAEANGVHIDAGGPLRILDIATGGLLLALGNATGGQRSATEQNTAEAGRANAEAARDVAAVAALAVPAGGSAAAAPGIERAVHDGAQSGVADGIDRAAGGDGGGSASRSASYAGPDLTDAPGAAIDVPEEPSWPK